MKGLRTKNGCEAETNDGNVKYILRKVTSFPAEGMEQVVYNSFLFIHTEGSSWQQANNAGGSYMSVDDFIQALAHVPEMSQAYKELTQI